MRGRKPMPAAQRKLRGRSHHKKKPGKIPVVPIGEPDIPENIASDSYALEAWNKWKTTFLEMNVLTKKDWGALAVLCSAWSQLRHADEVIAKYGVVIEKKKRHGVQLMQNPAIAIRRAAWAMIAKMSSEFGLTPAAMQRVRESVGDPGDTAKNKGEESDEGFLFGSRRTVAGGGKVLPMRRQ